MLGICFGFRIWDFRFLGGHLGCRSVALLAAVLFLAGCAGPAVRNRSPVPSPPLFIEDSARADELFAGKSMAEIRRLILGAMGTPVTASFRGASLQEVARELSQKSGLGIGITPDVYRADGNRLIDLDVRGLPAKQVLDWVTRLVGAFYAAEGPSSVFITRDRTWGSQDRLRLQSYSIGTFVLVARPVTGRFVPRAEAAKLEEALGYCLRYAMIGRPDARLIVDETGSRLSATLPPRGLVKLEAILEELKQPRRDEPPPPDPLARERAALDAARVVCNFERQDVSRILADIGRQANVNIGYDYRRIAEARRTMPLALGETSLVAALQAVAKAAGLGDVVYEPGRRFWILATDQDHSLLRETGELPWDRSVVRSYYIKDLVDQYSIETVAATIQKTVAPRKDDNDLPIGFWEKGTGRILIERNLNAQKVWTCPAAFYHSPTGRLIVIDDDESQRAVAAAIESMIQLKRPKRGEPK